MSWRVGAEIEYGLGRGVSFLCGLGGCSTEMRHRVVGVVLGVWGVVCKVGAED